MRISVPVLSTIRNDVLESYAPRRVVANLGDGLKTRNWLSPMGSEVLGMATFVEMDRRWTESEIDRARRQRDPRVRQAVENHGDHGIAEYIAAGPSLLATFRSARDRPYRIRGAALVRACIDLARCGLDRVEVGCIEELHELYLEQASSPLLRIESLDEAWKWVTEIRHGVTSLVEPCSSNQWRAFDYLTESVSRHNDPVPFAAWNKALEYADEAPRLFAIALAAATLDNRDVAEEAFSALLDRGSPAGYYGLGITMFGRGEYASAIHLFEAGYAYFPSDLASYCDLLLGVCYEQLGDLKKAELNYRSAVEAQRDAAPELGRLLVKRGEDEAARQYLEIGVADGDPSSALLLGCYLLDEEPERRDEAFRLIEYSALNSEGWVAPNRLGQAYKATKNIEAAKRWFKVALDRGSAEAANELGLVFARESDRSEAHRFFLIAADQGYAQAMHNLGVLYEELADMANAEVWYRKAGRENHAKAYCNLGTLLWKQSRVAEARASWRSARDLGEGLASLKLGVSYANSDSAVAIELYREAAEDAVPGAASRLAAAALRLGDKLESAEWLEVARERDEAADALFEIAGIYLTNDGDIGTARRIFTEAAALGSAAAVEVLKRL